MSLRFAILGFLSVKPFSGYDLRKAMDASVQHFWPADQAQVYRTLTRLIADGLVAVQAVEGDSRQRKLHFATQAGLAELDAWLRAIAPVEETREPFLLKMFFGGRIGAADVRAQLQARRAEAHALRDTFQAIAASLPKGGDISAVLRRATLINGLRHVEAEIIWIDETLEALP
ncbi:DNA-binding transcriptional regulator, PadR family [Yoonia tamlensis]|uniref:DNA-binding transcriptional regulator, PadR family n=1 Tax=Yoonia tamlensis TaxID=390270 RepID=A0A1I6FTU6_9RHOB|nr:PadR family transcriptional regulator [Yoonia tamlensis]SFR33380.1 DNA-binding transcriptional regulator, PadR family [Yoonia tamlensis]